MYKVFIKKLCLTLFVFGLAVFGFGGLYLISSSDSFAADTDQQTEQKKGTQQPTESQLKPTPPDSKLKMDEPSLKRGGESTELLQSRKSRCAKAEAECDEACRSGGSTNVAQVLGAEGDDDKDGDDGGDDESQSDPELSQCYNHCTNERKRCEGGK